VDNPDICERMARLMPAMTSLHDCYNDIKKILGEKTEPFESVKLVEEYRRYWKPEDVRILLLAESHVFTKDSDRAIRIPDIPNLEGYPKEYAKFVYCLGYGEKLLTGYRTHSKKDGTPQFWKIFFSCINKIESNNDFRPILGKTNYAARLRNKIGLLKKLKIAGVWLVDSSIVALYDSGKKPNAKKMSSAIRTSWGSHTKNVIEECNPDHVIVIGKGVAKIVDRDLKKMVGSNFSIISQPNAHLSAIEHLDNFQKYYRFCMR